MDWKTQHTKDVISLKLMYRFNLIPTKISTWFFINIDKLVLKFMWKGKGSKLARTILKKKTIVGGIKLSDFNIYNLATVITRVWY